MRSEVQIFPDPPLFGAIAQLGERLPCTQEVGGSIPPGSTNFACTLLHRTQVFDESNRNYTFDSLLLFNNLEQVFDVLSGSVSTGIFCAGEAQDERGRECIRYT